MRCLSQSHNEIHFAKTCLVNLSMDVTHFSCVQSRIFLPIIDFPVMFLFFSKKKCLFYFGPKWRAIHVTRNDPNFEILSYNPNFPIRILSFAERSFLTWEQIMRTWCSMNCLRRIPKKYHALNSIPYSSSSSSASNLLEKGRILRQSTTFSELEVEKYSNLTLDFNPLHFDSKFAKDAGFDHSLVPGMLVASVFPRVIASHFVSSSFSLFFRHPCLLIR